MNIPDAMRVSIIEGFRTLKSGMGIDYTDIDVMRALARIPEHVVDFYTGICVNLYKNEVKDKTDFDPTALFYAWFVNILVVGYLYGTVQTQEEIFTPQGKPILH